MTFLIVLVGWIFTLCIHEYSHARVAYDGGDHTVKEKGYLSFNPLRYADPVNSLLLPLLFLVLGGLGLPGGAVYIEHWRLRSKHWDSAVSLAGPLSNLLFAFLLIALLKVPAVAEGAYGPGLAFLTLIEVTAVVLNLVPVPPLDGYGILRPYLPASAREAMDRAGAWSYWVFFIALWYVPPISDSFWTGVGLLARGMGVPVELAQEGLRAFMFWKRL